MEGDIDGRTNTAVIAIRANREQVSSFNICSLVHSYRQIVAPASLLITLVAAPFGSYRIKLEHEDRNFKTLTRRFNPVFPSRTPPLLKLFQQLRLATFSYPLSSSHSFFMSISGCVENEDQPKSDDF